MGLELAIVDVNEHTKETRILLKDDLWRLLYEEITPHVEKRRLRKDVYITLKDLREAVSAVEKRVKRRSVELT